MSIVSSVIWKSHNKGNGRLRVFENHTDHTGKIHEHRYTCPEDHDIDQALLDWVPKLEASLIEGEKEQVQQDIEDGVDPALIVSNHITTNQRIKASIRAMMLGDPSKLLKAAQFVQTFTDGQLETSYTQAQRIKIRTRQNYILNNQSIFNSDLREEL